MITLSLGYPQTLVADQIYALPARASHLFAHGSFTSIDFANNAIMSDPDNVVATEFSATVGSGFIRFNGGAAEVKLTPLG